MPKRDTFLPVSEQVCLKTQCYDLNSFNDDSIHTPARFSKEGRSASAHPSVGRSTSLKILRNGRRWTSKKSLPLRKSNSCSTLFLDQSVTSPDLDSILSSIAAAIHVNFVDILKLDRLPAFDSIFDEKAHPLTVNIFWLFIKKNVKSAFE